VGSSRRKQHTHPLEHSLASSDEALRKQRRKLLLYCATEVGSSAGQSSFTNVYPQRIIPRPDQSSNASQALSFRKVECCGLKEEHAHVNLPQRRVVDFSLSIPQACSP
jgi:hypothetical protein